MNARAATLRDDRGEVVGEVYGGTACLDPRKPTKLASYDGDREHVIRCGACAGCRELDRRRRADQLVNHYGQESREIWHVEIQCPLESQGRLTARLWRACGDMFERAFYRTSRTSIALIAVGGKPMPSAMRALAAYSHRSYKLARPSSRKCWRRVTRGIRVPREEWGEQVKRFYHCGLPPLPRDRKWEVATRGGITKRHAVPIDAAAVRGFDSGVSLHAPWVARLLELVRTARRQRSRKPRYSTSPRRVDSALPSRAKRASGETSRFLDALRVHGASQSAATGSSHAPSARPHNNLPYSYKAGGYRSSLHSGNAKPSPRGDRERAGPAFLDDWLSRMKAMAAKRDT